MLARLNYFFIRLLSFFISLLPYRAIHGLGKILGVIAYATLRKFRKRAFSNLALARDLALSPREIRRIAKQSFQNLAITFLEFGKIAREKDLSRLVTNQNPQEAASLLEKKTGIIFFVGHQANWELLFLDGIWRFSDGVAVARPIKNHILYEWVKSVREQYGGKIIEQKKALKEGLRALKAGKYLGIVGDQGMPESPFYSPFLGRSAYTSSAPALLSYKTGCPIIVATIRRKKGHYQIQYSKPLFPDKSKPIEKETERLMNQTLSAFAKSIQAYPGQWLWLHNRWKQETPNAVYYRFRMDSILIALPSDSTQFKRFFPLVQSLRSIYPKAFLSLCMPKCFQSMTPKDFEIIYYDKDQELLFQDYRFKLVFNFTGHSSLKRHFQKQSAFEVLSLPDLYQVALDHEHIEKNQNYSDDEILKRALCRPGTFWKR